MLLLLVTSFGCAPRAALETQLEREVLALSQRMRMLEEDLAACGTPDAQSSLYAELFQVFSGSGVGIEQRGPATVMTLRASQLFTDPWGSSFRPEADPTLDLLATALMLNPEYDIAVVGHTSTAPIPASQRRRYFNHVALSLGLSARVADHLMTNYEVPRTRFTVAGRGTWDSVASNEEDVGRDQNQRVEIHLTRAVTEIGEGTRP